MRIRRDRAYWLLVAGALLWLTMLFAAPYAGARGWGWSAVLYDAFHRVCHQIPERSFSAWGHPLAACHRCTGLYAGFTLGLLLWPTWARPARRLLEAPRWLLLPAVPMLVDVVLPFNTAASRSATGFVAAFPVSLLALAALAQLTAPGEPSIEGEEYEPV